MSLDRGVAVKALGALRGSALVRADPDHPLAAHEVLVALFRALGTPSEVALATLAPSSATGRVHRRTIERPSTRRLLHGLRASAGYASFLERALDWDPTTELLAWAP